MHVVWAHDHTFYFNETGKFYSGGKLPYAVWERYLGVFDSMTVACRGQRTSADADMKGKTLSSGPNVDFLVLPSLSNPVNKLTKRGIVEHSLREAIAKADAVIARMPSELGAEAIRVARSLGKPFAVEMVACAWDGLWNYGNAQGKLYAPFSLWKTRSLVKRAPYGIYVTEKFLQKRYPLSAQGVEGSCSNVEIPAVSPDVLDRRLKRIAAGKGTWNPDRPFRIGMIGSLNGKTKGIDTALRAFARVQWEELPSFEFHILGDGSADRWRSLAEKLGIGSLVKFCGVLTSGSAVFEWLDELDLYVQPSFQEGLPRATIEAMSRACPVLGSTAGGIPELIGAEWLHKPGGYKQFAEHLGLAIGNTAWMKEQAELNFHTAQKYTKAKLDQQRRAFWESFRDYAATFANGAEAGATANNGGQVYVKNDNAKGAEAL
ncbi:glycosyltransferase family 4 protein [Paenibacillus lycopersici]|uniref:Glycosyltransferase family 4 protein n=1 Tax=Paenibacillus lycopersici TaxID=2704462 RepID=A0A6C0G6V1_9BACL|nr:glycosyltransferase family 4 protein [Paenibacillus lycopersici]QHT61915.1 glycosyltransferase family 4 protein [Paenibacillus lycopersici]